MEEYYKAQLPNLTDFEYLPTLIPARLGRFSHAGRRCCPHTRVIGRTFEFTFNLPKPAKAGGGSPSRGKTRSSRKGSSAQGNDNVPAPQPKNGTRANKARPSAPKPKKAQLTPEQRKAHRRTRIAQRRQRRKERGLCRDCPNPAVPGHIRCADCAHTNRQTDNRRNRGPDRTSQP